MEEKQKRIEFLEKKELQPDGIDVAVTRISQRATFNHSLTAGQTAVEYEPDGVAAQEIRALYQLACKHAGMITRNKPNKERKTA